MKVARVLTDRSPMMNPACWQLAAAAITGRFRNSSDVRERPRTGGELITS